MKIPRFISSTLAIAAVIGTGAFARADVKLPAIISDHMVLQRNVEAPIWGWAEPGEEVTVTFGAETKTTKADAAGKWMVKVTPKEGERTSPPNPDGIALTVKGKNTLIVMDVLAGEVWLCSGQSNMAMQVGRAMNFPQELAAAKFPQIRMFTVARSSPNTAQTDCKGEWQVCTPETVGKFSAAAYFFGREIHKTLAVPVGLINSSVGGTPIEAWISPKAQETSPGVKAFFAEQDKRAKEFDQSPDKAKYDQAVAHWKEEVAKAKAAGAKKFPAAPQHPMGIIAVPRGGGGLYNGMIEPLAPFAIRGAIWYQGEANAGKTRATLYSVQLPLLVEDWRGRWGQGDFPFAWVQLPNYNAPALDWPGVRESMLKSLAVPNTGMAITIDIGMPGNIHPTNKQEVGHRLALWALGSVYGQKGETSGPLPAGHQINGSQITLSFSHAEGLVAKGGELTGFVIAGADHQWHAATARIVGSQVIVSSPDVASPIAARYAWSDNPTCNLYNSAGLPASPFRTDDWPR